MKEEKEKKIDHRQNFDKKRNLIKNMYIFFATWLSKKIKRKLLAVTVIRERKNERLRKREKR